MNKEQVTRAHQTRIANCGALTALIDALAKANAPDPKEVHAAHLLWESPDQHFQARAITTGGWTDDWRAASGGASLTGWAFDVFATPPGGRRVREADRYFEAAVGFTDGGSVLERVVAAFVQTMAEHGIATPTVGGGGVVPPVAGGAT